MTNRGKLRLTGAAGGLVNGLFGGGGGMVLLPLFQRWCGIAEKKSYATCVAVVFPLCLISSAVYLYRTELDLSAALPYLLGGLAGGALGGVLMDRVSAVFLRRLFAAFLLYGGVRYLL